VIWVVKKHSLVKKDCEMKPARTKVRNVTDQPPERGKNQKVSENSDSEISTSKIQPIKGIKYTWGNVS